MLKKIFIVLFVIVAFLLASIYIFRANIKKYAIRTILKSFPLPNVALADVQYDETTGKLKLEDIKVKNPAGFESEFIMEADSIGMDISFTAKPNLQLNISKVDIDAPVFYVERSRRDKWNFQEYPKKNISSNLPAETRRAKAETLLNEKTPVSPVRKNSFDFVKEAFAAEETKPSQVFLPRTINIDNGTVHFMDNFVADGKMHSVDLSPINGTILLQYVPEKNVYEKITFDGTCSIAGQPGRLIKGDFELYPLHEKPSYAWEINAYSIPVLAIKPYLDRYSPFIVSQGSFNMNSNVRSVDGMVEGSYTMEIMDLDFAINPKRSKMPFLETSVKKLTLYLTNQKGNVVIDFTQKSDASGKVQWGLGPIAKRAIGLMAIDTVIEVIDAIEKGRKGGIAPQALPGDVPPEVIDIFRGIFN